jgi:hypothetical protein
MKKQAKGPKFRALCDECKRRISKAIVARKRALRLLPASEPPEQ